MFELNADDDCLAFPVPELPPTVRTRAVRFSFPPPPPPQPSPTATLTARARESLRGPALFVAGALAGCVFATCAVVMTNSFMAWTSAPGSASAATLGR